jgi:hypothetical protein
MDIAGKRMSLGDLFLGGGLVVALIATFLPWHSTSYTYVGATVTDGRNAFGYWSGWIFFLVVLAGLGLFAIRNFFPQVKIPMLPVTDAMLYLGGGVVLLLATVLWWVTGGGYGNLESLFNYEGYSSGVSFGLFIGLLAALAVGIGGFMKREEVQPETKPMGSFQIPSTPAPPPIT